MEAVAQLMAAAAVLVVAGLAAILLQTPSAVTAAAPALLAVTEDIAQRLARMARTITLAAAEAGVFFRVVGVQAARVAMRRIGSGVVVGPVVAARLARLTPLGAQGVPLTTQGALLLVVVVALALALRQQGEAVGVLLVARHTPSHHDMVAAGDVLCN